MRPPAHRLLALAALVVLFGATAVCRPAAAQPALAPPPEPPAPEEQAEADLFDVRLSAETTFQLFRRAALPGPGGALVSTLLSAPIHQSVALRVDDVDVPWQADSVDVELSAWGSVNPGEPGDERRVDGDVTLALVRHRLGPVRLTLGRQLEVGGAARMCRFDGLAVGVESPFGLGAEAYGGFAVLPLWNARPGYQLLGSAADGLLRTPAAIEQPNRAGAWLAGGRVHYVYPGLLEAGASFHEQRANGELDRRNLGIDAHLEPVEWLDASGQVVLDVDSWQPSDARGALDLRPVEGLRVSAEYLHTVPALFLSRQSVLSVFSTDPFHEMGGSASFEPVGWLELQAGGYAELFAADWSTGMRLQGSARFAPFESELLVLRAGYGRVSEPENGYHSLRLSAGVRPIAPLLLAAESYLYVYDSPVRHTYGAVPLDSKLSWLGAASGEWSFVEWGAALLGGSLGITPYAKLDAQALARLRLDFDLGEPR
jgi:hypothetical protein